MTVKKKKVTRNADEKLVKVEIKYEIGLTCWSHYGILSGSSPKSNNINDM